MRLLSGLENASDRTCYVPEQLHGRGVVGELAEQGASVDPVPVPFSEGALGTWAAAEGLSLARVRQEAALYVEVLEVRHRNTDNCTVVAVLCHSGQGVLALVVYVAQDMLGAKHTMRGRRSAGRRRARA